MGQSIQKERWSEHTNCYSCKVFNQISCTRQFHSKTLTEMVPDSALGGVLPCYQIWFQTRGAVAINGCSSVQFAGWVMQMVRLYPFVSRWLGNTNRIQWYICVFIPSCEETAEIYSVQYDILSNRETSGPALQ